MATTRLSCFRLFCSYGKLVKPIDTRPSYALIKRNYHCGESAVKSNCISNGFGIMELGFAVDKCYNRGMKASEFEFRLSNLGLSSVPFDETGPLLSCRSYSSGSSNQEGNPEATASGSGDIGGLGKVICPIVLRRHVITNAAAKSKEVYVEMISQVHELLDAHPYLKDVFVPAGGSMVGKFSAGIVMPRLLRRFHQYSTQGSPAFLSGNSLWWFVPYENSFWGALKDPI